MFLCALKHVSAAYSVRSPPPCGEGLGVGVVRFLRRWRHHDLAASPPSPPSPHKGGREQTEFAACIDSTLHEHGLTHGVQLAQARPLPSLCVEILRREPALE